jgi:hypothetical protein
MLSLKELFLGGTGSGETAFFSVGDNGGVGDGNPGRRFGFTGIGGGVLLTDLTSAFSNFFLPKSGEGGLLKKRFLDCGELGAGGS